MSRWFETHWVEGPALVLGDRGNLARAVPDILTNAVKFTPPGGEVNLVATVAAQTHIVRIICSDAGIGIPDGESPRISERFLRGSNASVAQIPGAGPGLAIVRGIVESHGGRPFLVSTENSGTTVSVSLPGAPGLTSRRSRSTASRPAIAPAGGMHRGQCPLVRTYDLNYRPSRLVGGEPRAVCDSIGENMNMGGFAASTPGGAAADLMILASTLAALAGLLFLLYVVAVVAGVTCGTVARATRRGRER